jgi:hypothetical protein
MIINSIIRFFQSDNELTINKLGKFIKKTIPSKLEDNQILPPKVILEFEFIDDVNGFIFVDKISQWESIRLLDADDQVTYWVKDLKNAIQNNKSVSFENFGTFYMNPSGIICFDSDIIKELNSEYYGMAAVPILKSDKIETKNEVLMIKDEGLEIQDERVEITEEMEEVDNEFSKVVPIIVDTTIDVKEENENRELDDPSEEAEVMIIPNKKRKNRWWETIIFIFIILAAIALIGYLFRTDIQKFYQKHFQKPAVVENPAPAAPVQSVDTITTIDKTDTLPVSEPQKVDQIPTQTPKVIQNEPTKPVHIENSSRVISEYPSVSFESGKFYVIAGSFGKKGDAIQHIKDKKLAQYNPVLVVGNSRVRVCIGTFKTEAEATAFANRIDKTYWVLK